MALKTLLFISLFAVCFLGAPWAPLLGVLGYMGHYCVGPERQWWHARLSGLGLRYSFLLAIATAVGIALNWRRLRFGKQLLVGQEKLLLLLLGIAWLSVWLGPSTMGRYTTVDHPSVKFTKMVIFVLMMTHVVTDIKKLDRLLWVLVIGVMILGVQAYDTPRRAFMRGRLNSVGGPDFSEANFFAAYLVTMMPIITVQFIRGGWLGKALCLVAGVFGMNAIVLTRSRGAVVGLAVGGLVAACLSPKKYRLKIIVILVVAGLGGLHLADPQFIERMSTITRSQDQRDTSAQSRFDLWSAAMKMIADHPAGVGVGNFYQNIGRYNRNLAGKDAHNTYVRCAAELGLQGLTVFGLLIFNAIWMLLRIRRRADKLPAEHRVTIIFISYAMLVSLAMLLASCLTISLTYVEFMWWSLMLPVCLVRVVDNIEADVRQPRLTS